MQTLSTVPTSGGVPDFLSRLSQGVVGGNRSSSQSSAVGGNANVSVNPTIVSNIGGGSPTISPSVNAPVSGSPYASGSASSAGTDTPGYLNTGALRATPGAYPGSYDPITGRTVDAGMDWLMPVALGGGALALLFMMEE